MKYTNIVDHADKVLASLAGTPPSGMGDLPGAINTALDGVGVPFEDRRYVCALLAERARQRALGAKAPADKVLRRIADEAMTAHDAWAGAGVFNKGKLRAETDAEIKAAKGLADRVGTYVDGAVKVLHEARGVLQVNLNAAVNIAAPQLVIPDQNVRKRVGQAPAPKEIDPPKAEAPVQDANANANA